MFPSEYGQSLTPGIYWIMGVAGALGLFASVLLHELGHARVAQSQGVGMAGITLFIFGGVAEMSQDSPSPKAEFLVAVGGPIVSLVLGVIFMAIAWSAPMPAAVGGVVAYLGFINLALLIFNLIPAFPLDGGRVLRSALWAWKGNIVWATRVCSAMGNGFGLLLIILGVYEIVVSFGSHGGGVFSGVWSIVLGMFLRGAAKASYQQVMTRELLQGKAVRELMNHEPIHVTPDLTIEDFVNHFVYRHHHKMFPAVEDGKLWGCLNVEQFRDIERDQWAGRSIREFIAPCDDTNAIDADAPATTAMNAMIRNNVSRLVVTEDHHQRLVGIIAFRDLIGYLQLHQQVEPGG